jgi:uncharacterized membrane protein
LKLFAVGSSINDVAQRGGSLTTESTVSPVQKNIQAIIKLEEEAFHTLSRGERVSNAIARFVGQMSFAVYHIIWFGIWALINTGLVPRIEPVDPFPFTLLTTLVSLEAIFLSIFLLINQNAMSRQSDHRAHLDLQVNLLAEQEATQMLRDDPPNLPEIRGGSR